MNLAYLKYEKPMRERYKARGLTSHGKKRVNKLHPQLRGLNRQEYHRCFMQQWRRSL